MKTMKGLKLGMAACCAAMLVPVGAYVLGGGAVTSLGAAATALAPILLCLGAHGLMFVLMGRSCHGDARTRIEPAAVPRPVPTNVPAVARRAEVRSGAFAVR